MLALTNPGIYTASGGVSEAGWMICGVFMAVGVVIMVASVAGGAEELLAVGLLFMAIGGFAPLVSSSIDGDSTGQTKTEYTASVQVWLAGDYGIAINEEDATKLIDGDELALTVDGTATAIEIIEGEKGTIAVKVVGGSILQPSAPGAPAATE